VEAHTFAFELEMCVFHASLAQVEGEVSHLVCISILRGHTQQQQQQQQQEQQGQQELQQQRNVS
jgi:hypothetical protein